METLMSMEEMRAQLEQLEREETEIDDQLGQVIKQQPDLLIKGFGFYTFSCFSHNFTQNYQLVFYSLKITTEITEEPNFVLSFRSDSRLFLKSDVLLRF